MTFWQKCLMLIVAALLWQPSLADETKPRFVTLAPHIVELLYAVGAGDQIVATIEHSDFPAAALDIPRIGNYAGIQVEKILQLQPDYVIAWKSGNPEQDVARLRKLGLKVLYSDPRSLDDVAKELRLFAGIADRESEGEALAKKFEQGLAQLRQRYQGANPVSVFYELWSRPLTTVANQAWPQQILEVCGATNPFKAVKGDYPQINLEQALVADPDVIIQPQSGKHPNPDAINWKQYPHMKAVKSQAILYPDADKLHRMTPRMLNETRQLCEAIHQASTAQQENKNT